MHHSQHVEKHVDSTHSIIDTHTPPPPPCVTQCGAQLDTHTNTRVLTHRTRSSPAHMMAHKLYYRYATPPLTSPDKTLFHHSTSCSKKPHRTTTQPPKSTCASNVPLLSCLPASSSQTSPLPSSPFPTASSRVNTTACYNWDHSSPAPSGSALGRRLRFCRPPQRSTCGTPLLKNTKTPNPSPQWLSYHSTAPRSAAAGLPLFSFSSS